MSILSRLIRAPWFHFLALGALLFAFVRPDAEPAAIEGTAARAIVIDGTALDDGAIEAAIEEEILVREALALGVDRGQRVIDARLSGIADFLELEAEDGELAADAAPDLDLRRRDPIVRRHLVTLVRMMLSRVGPEDFPTDAELESYLADHAAAFAAPARVRLTHVYLSRERRGASLAGDAARMGEALITKRTGPREAASLGDSFVHGSRDVLASQADLERTFGAGFAAAVGRHEPQTWSGPVESPYGLHFVWIHERLPSRVPSLDEVRSRVLHQVLAERRENRLRERLAGLRARYQVRVSRASGLATPSP